jgi:SAM-dependent methyltransferase
VIERFWREFARLDASPCRLLECGSRRQPGQPPGAGAAAREHRADAEVWGLDAEPGEGVDVVGDLHDIPIRATLFDAVLICSTLEHVRRPWVVARELARVTRPGGLLYCATHQSFPYHPGYGGDYFRFSADALGELFAPDAGWAVLDAGHEFPCKVLPLGNVFAHAHDWDFSASAWLNSWILCRRE